MRVLIAGAVILLGPPLVGNTQIPTPLPLPPPPPPSLDFAPSPPSGQSGSKGVCPAPPPPQLTPPTNDRAERASLPQSDQRPSDRTHHSLMLEPLTQKPSAVGAHRQAGLQSPEQITDVLPSYSTPGGTSHVALHKPTRLKRRGAVGCGFEDLLTETARPAATSVTNKVPLLYAPP